MSNILTASRLARAWIVANLKRLLKGSPMKQRLNLALTITKNGEHWNEFTSAPVVDVAEAPTSAEYFKGAAARIVKIDAKNDGPFAVSLTLDGNLIAKADSLNEQGVNRVVDLAIKEMTALRELKKSVKK